MASPRLYRLFFYSNRKRLITASCLQGREVSPVGAIRVTAQKINKWSCKTAELSLSSLWLIESHYLWRWLLSILLRVEIYRGKHVSCWSSHVVRSLVMVSFGTVPSSEATRAMAYLCLQEVEHWVPHGHGHGHRDYWMWANCWWIFKPRLWGRPLAASPLRWPLFYSEEA